MPQRLVTLAPNVTELVFAAGAGDRLVGVSEFSDFPASAGRLPRIGNAFRVDEEACSRAPGSRAGLEDRHAAVDDRPGSDASGSSVLVLDTQRLDDIATAIERIGAAVGTSAVAVPAQRMLLREQIAALGAFRNGVRPVRVFVEVDDQPLYTVTGR